MTTPPWDVVRWAHDKRAMRELAVRAGIRSPRLWSDPRDFAATGGTFPVVVKPAVREAVNPLTRDKAWRADDRAQLERLYEAACRFMPPDVLMIQEHVPGGGARQLSYAALAVDGEPVATLVARRTRQYPMDFGRASTFVESIDDRRVDDAGARLLGELSFTGLVEIEFKETDDGELALLDVNPRVWGWHTIGRRAGVDFSWLLWRFACGLPVPPVRARPGARWMWPAADVPVALRELLGRRMSVRAYLRDFRRPLDLATLARDDPLPGVVELPLQATAALRKRAGHGEGGDRRPRGAPVAHA